MHKNILYIMHNYYHCFKIRLEISVAAILSDKISEWMDSLAAAGRQFCCINKWIVV